MTHERSKSTLSKIGILILYPVQNLGLPLVVFGMRGLQASDGKQVGSGVQALVSASGILSVALVALVAWYLFDTMRNKTFVRKSDGTRKADVGDYFALFFSVFTIGNVVSAVVALLR